MASGIIAKISQWADDTLGMVWPRQCPVCGKSLIHGERLMCLQCAIEMPRTGLHLQDFSVIHQRLAGKTPIARGAALFYYYSGNPYTRLIHDAKYNGYPWIARELASIYAEELTADGFFDGIDMIIPVPLHPLKRMRRGYNQTEYIAEGLHRVTGLPVAHCLRMSRQHGSQTRLGAYARWLNSRATYQATHTETLHRHHVLVVDDVLTTGATLLSCCQAIHEEAPTATVSVLTLGLTHMR